MVDHIHIFILVYQIYTLNKGWRERQKKGTASYWILLLVTFDVLYTLSPNEWRSFLGLQLLYTGMYINT
jgi:hypothetical protein